MATGWTFREIEAHDLHDLRDLGRYWEDVPPLHVLVAARLGALKAPRRGAKKTTAKDARDLAARFGLAVSGGTP